MKRRKLLVQRHSVAHPRWLESSTTTPYGNPRVALSTRCSILVPDTNSKTMLKIQVPTILSCAS